jgi:hypothetical protein
MISSFNTSKGIHINYNIHDNIMQNSIMNKNAIVSIVNKCVYLITSNLIKLLRKKNQLSKKLKKHPTNNSLLKYYKSYRNKLNSLVEERKNKFL